jgi:putative DNA primase/helicase
MTGEPSIEVPLESLRHNMAQRVQGRKRGEWLTGADAKLTFKSASKSYASACHVLRDATLREAALGPGALEYDEMLCAPTIGRRAIEDSDIGRFREGAELRIVSTQGRPIRFSAETAQHAIVQVARERSFHPVRAYLESLRKRRASGAVARLADLIGIPPGDALARAMLRRWAISAAARPLRPGCKVDTVLILVGRQGRGKSSLFDALANPWFSDSAMTLESKDAYLQLHGAWLYEWAELESMQRARELTTVKAFLTSREDSFRPPYGRFRETHKRSGVIVGSTNRTDFLSDATGNRRYWPIRVRCKIDLVAVAKLRDDFWTEAVSLFDKREHWWLDDGEECELAKVHKRYERPDAWESAILAYAATREAVLISDILREAIHKELAQVTNADERRVADVLLRAGYQGRRCRIDAKRGYWWTRKRRQRMPGEEG